MSDGRVGRVCICVNACGVPGVRLCVYICVNACGVPGVCDSPALVCMCR